MRWCNIIACPECNKCSAAAAADAYASEFENYEKEIGAATTPFHVLEKCIFFVDTFDRSIDRATVKRRLGLVEKDFAGLLDSVVETEFSVRYKALLARIVGAVLYRDAWYRKHANEALLSIDEYFEHKKIGGGAGQGPSVDLVTKEKEKEDLDGKKMNAGPMSFAASPGHFKRMLENHLRCSGP